MTSTTIEYFSKKIGISVECLIQILLEIGIKKNFSDSISKFEQEKLLGYIKNKSKFKLNKFVFQRKTHTMLNICNENGKNKSIKVEVRKKHVYLGENIDTCISKHINKEKKKHINFLPKEQNKNEIIDNINCNANKSVQCKNKKSIKLFNDKENELIEEKNNKVLIKKRKDSFQIERKKKRSLKNITNLSSYPKSLDEDKNFMKVYHNKSDFYKKNKDKKNKKNLKQNKIYYSSENRNSKKEKDIYLNNIQKHKKISTSLKQKFQPNTTVNRTVVIGKNISISKLANKMAVKSAKVIKETMKLGMMVTINQVIDQETAQLIAEEMGHTVITKNENILEQSLITNSNTNNIIKLEKRAPIVTIMGHVNHGKTSLLDKIRTSNIAKKEVGNITQNISAYHVITKKGSITFIDTPGHSAFYNMRSRGICITDIMVLVIAIDDGIMPQTIESINHAKSHKIPIIVAVNKIDKKILEPDQIKNELSKHGIISEEWGGENQFVYISAKYGTGISALIDAILLQAEMLELKADKNLLAKGTVIESFLDKNLGPTAIILVREGTLKKGNIVLCGCEFGKIRSMYNEFKKEIFSAGPSIPVKISGLSGIVNPGDEIISVNDEKKAREIAYHRKEKFREIRLENKNNTIKKSFHDMDKNIKKEINILLKSNTRGSIDPIINAIEYLSRKEITVKVINSGVGSITESDVIFASSFNAIIIGFNVKVDLTAQKIIEHEKLNYKNYSTIYDLTTDIEKIVQDTINIKTDENILGLAEVKNIFYTTKTGTVIGCLVIQGKIKKNHKIKIFRKEEVLYEGTIESLRRFKYDTNEVKNGMECGIGIKNYIEICSGDIIKVYKYI